MKTTIIDEITFDLANVEFNKFNYYIDYQLKELENQIKKAKNGKKTKYELDILRRRRDEIKTTQKELNAFIELSRQEERDSIDWVED